MLKWLYSDEPDTLMAPSFKIRPVTYSTKPPEMQHSAISSAATYIQAA